MLLNPLRVSIVGLLVGFKYSGRHEIIGHTYERQTTENERRHSYRDVKENKTCHMERRTNKKHIVGDNKLEKPPESTDLVQVAHFPTCCDLYPNQPCTCRGETSVPGLLKLKITVQINQHNTHTNLLGFDLWKVKVPPESTTLPKCHYQQFLKISSKSVKLFELFGKQQTVIRPPTKVELVNSSVDSFHPKEKKINWVLSLFNKKNKGPYQFSAAQFG